MLKNNKLIDILSWSAFVCLSVWLTLSNGIEANSRDGFLMNSIEFEAYTPEYRAPQFCNDIRKNQLNVPCNSISSKLNTEISDEIRNKAQTEADNALVSYQSLKKSLTTDQSANLYKLQLIEILDKRINEITQVQQVAKSSINNPSENKELLKVLLIAQGYSYNEYSDRFKLVSYDISRYIINPSEIKSQLQRLHILSTALPAITLLWLTIYWIVIRHKLNTTGSIFFAAYALIVTLGLNIIRDASLNYGTESSLYHLNPFRLVLERQLQIVGISTIIFLLVLFIAKPFGNWLERKAKLTSSNLLTAACVLICVTAYLIFGQALGAETIKIISCFICALLLSQHGRVIELLQEHFGFKKLASQLTNSIKSWQANKDTGQIKISTVAYVKVFFIRKVITPVALLLLSIVIAALLFSDLGGSLIAASVLTFSLFTLLGRKFASGMLIILAGTASALILLSDKVRGRFQLMMEPMRANISDFARLIEFDKSAQPWGYGLNQIQWCSGDGVCVPLQSLSDYMPTLISGLMGTYLSVVLFCLMASLLIFLIYKSFIPSWYFDEANRFTSMFACLLCLASLTQLTVTFFGNWRLMPLTGLGTPLVSIGLSSFLASTIGISLALSVAFKKT
jgi:cell division protein FtsW (lipid II flippase)